MAITKLGAGVGALAIAGGLLFGGTAVAAPAAPAGATSVAKPAPKCITEKEVKGNVETTVHVTNRCKEIHKVQLIMSRGADSRCFSLQPRADPREHLARGEPVPGPHRGLLTEWRCWLPAPRDR